MGKTATLYKNEIVVFAAPHRNQKLTFRLQMHSVDLPTCGHDKRTPLHVQAERDFTMVIFLVNEGKVDVTAHDRFQSHCRPKPISSMESEEDVSLKDDSRSTFTTDNTSIIMNNKKKYNQIYARRKLSRKIPLQDQLSPLLYASLLQQHKSKSQAKTLKGLS
ncbi:hypothetical protein KIN20_029316 [Parelaphostrongylus tenuis]|uniref:Uncharacterized protein n=1 Tax=Parelaphostrongylus tenuis TaxID=148309 RepID=A0AAD5R2H4_PARTN|nr:hypothetical protein KIN20_029316 [Parelaphostrongylus tenuis]